MKIAELAGELLVDADARRAASRDFGGMVERVPRAVLKPRTAEDVVRAVRYARAERLPLNARGQGHTTRGQSLIADGLVIDTRSLAEIEIGAGFARVGAGCIWSTLLRRTLEAGQTPPVLTDYLGLTVGGTLSVGGIGGQSFRYGLQTDNVDELSVVTGAGELVTCSRSENPDLFDACRGGLGQCGIIVAARLRLVPAPARVRVYNLRYTSLQAFLADQEGALTDGRFDYVLGSLLPEAGAWGLVVEVVKYLAPAADPAEKQLLSGLACAPAESPRELPFFDYADRLAGIVQSMLGARHPWMDLFVGATSASAVISTAMREFAPEQLANGYVMTYPLDRAKCHTPFLGLPAEPRLFLFDVLPSLPAADPTATSRFETTCANVYESARGSSVYPIGYPVGRMDENDWKRQLGAAWEPLSAAKRRYDPDRILSPASRIFSQ